MDEMLRNRISDSRRLLGNPYAHIERLEEMETNTPQFQEATSDQIRVSRELLQNPHAHTDGSGKYSAIAPRENKASSATHTANRYLTEKQLENKATELLRNMWRDRQNLWEGDPPSDPMDIIDLAMAFRLIGYDFAYEEDLGHLSDSSKTKVAGLIDGASRSVRISRQFKPEVRRFTAAHELGHALLHNTGTSLHRDRPLDGSTFSRDSIEFQADKFAAFFLMPAKQLKMRFVELFGSERFTLNEEAAFALCGKSLYDVRKGCPTPRDISRLVANAKRYNEHLFPSLAEQFGVSIETMAIRLEELSLIE